MFQLVSTNKDFIFFGQNFEVPASSMVERSKINLHILLRSTFFAQPFSQWDKNLFGNIFFLFLIPLLHRYFYKTQYFYSLKIAKDCNFVAILNKNIQFFHKGHLILKGLSIFSEFFQSNDHNNSIIVL